MDWLGLRTEPFQPSKALAIGDEIEIDDVYGNRYVVFLVGLNFRFVDEVRGVMGGAGPMM